VRSRNRTRGLLWFFLWIAFFSLAFTPAYWIADTLLLSALVAAFIVFNGVKIHEVWKYRLDPKLREAHPGSGRGGVTARDRWRRWALDDQEDDKKHID
jgi:hypothetical protein